MCFLWIRVETDYISGIESNQIRIERERERGREWGESSAVKEKGFG
jgi:hypothetical protein